jgi:hypothetical protein
MLVFGARCSTPAKEISHETAIPIPDGGDLSTDGGFAGPICALDLAAPQSTWDQPRRTVPWILVLAAGTSDGGVPGDGGVDTGCTSAPVFGGPDDVTCRGVVTARGGGTNLELAFGDLAVLRWDATASSSEVAPPVLADGQTAWVDYRRSITLVCSGCGYYETRLVEVRAVARGPLIWVGREGVGLTEVSADLVQELFGVGVHEQLSCHTPIVAGCYRANRRVFDHILDTTPEQLIPAANLRHVNSPKGEYDVLWAHSIEGDVRRDPNCGDGPFVASDTGFAASRTSPPVD